MSESDITNPFFAAYITSLVRAALGEILNNIPPERLVFSVTTDGFITNATSSEVGACSSRSDMSDVRREQA